MLKGIVNPTVRRLVKQPLSASCCLYISLTSIRNQSTLKSTEIEPQNEGASSTTTTTTTVSDLPWYMRPEESPSISSPLRQIEIPDLPQDSPNTLKQIIEFTANELGIINLQIFDLRNIQNKENGSKDIAKFMIIGTGKSSKHLQKATTELQFFLKHELNKLTKPEGLVKKADLFKFQRRLKKKGKKGPNYANNDYGSSPNTWVMIDCKTDDIFVHFLTSDRRNDLRLEEIWGDAKDVNATKYLNNSNNARNDDDIFKGIRYYHTMNRTSQNKSKILNQIKFFSTRSNSLNQSKLIEFDSSINSDLLNRENWNKRFNLLSNLHINDSNNYPFSLIIDHFDALIINGFTINLKEFINFINIILQSPEINRISKNPLEIFHKRYELISNFINNNNPKITEKDNKNLTNIEIDSISEKLLPLLILTGTQFDNSNFITISKINKNFETLTKFNEDEISNTKLLYNSVIISNLKNLINSLIINSNDLQYKNTKNLDLIFFNLFLTSNEIESKHLLMELLNKNEFNLIIIYLKYSILTNNSKNCFKIIDEILPVLINLKLIDFKNNEWIKIVNCLLDICDPIGTNFKDLRSKLT
ncbi:hypothetical protein BVG19_g4192 [[Candida] boidinii]|nr:hypothetical protein BVG19_g4192 [[Candida] boidinii]OWB53045.1 hypothetical protein B5S27_g4632 [[Candida] boidinii]